VLDFTGKIEQLDLRSYIENESIKSIDLKFCDLLGAWRHVTVPVDSMRKDLFERGVGVDGSSIPKFADVTKGDVSIIPDMSRGFIDDAFDGATLSFICDVHHADDLSPHHADPRGVAKRAQEHLRSLDIADEILFIPELEYYVFEQVDYHAGEEEAYWKIISSEGSAKYPETGVSRWKIPEGRGYIVAPPFDAYVNMREQIVERLQGLGIGVKYHHHEGGSYGQQELELCKSGLLDTADNILLGKYTVNLTANEYGIRSTFMPKPFPNKAGTGLHYHMLLRKNGKTISYDPDGDAGLSKTALSFIAGILHHGRAVMAITCASTNSYRRLKPGFETPRGFFFSQGNREAAIRIPSYVTAPEAKRWEFRPSDATGNPYLSLPALLMAGLDGVEKGLDPKKEGLGPFDGRGPELKHTSRNLRKFLPADFTEALRALDSDHEFLLKGNVFSEELIRTYIDYKFNNEIAPMQNQPHPYEFELYFNI